MNKSLKGINSAVTELILTNFVYASLTQLCTSFMKFHMMARMMDSLKSVSPPLHGSNTDSGALLLKEQII